jgi:hypothetical protein
MAVCRNHIMLNACSLSGHLTGKQKRLIERGSSRSGRLLAWFCPANEVNEGHAGSCVHMSGYVSPSKSLFSGPWL